MTGARPRRPAGRRYSTGMKRPAAATPASAPAAPTPETIFLRALDLLRGWEAGGAWQEELPAAAEGAGRGVLQNGLLTLFRRRAVLDWVLARFCTRPVRPRLRRLLWWALAQLFWGRAPAPVVADLAVQVARRRGSPAEAGFVNAVLRAVVAAGPERLLAEAAAPGAPLHVRLSLSPELAAAWAGRLAPAELERLAALLLTPAPVTVRRRRRPAGAAVADSATGAELAPGLEPLPAPAFAPGAELFLAVAPERFFASAAFRAGGYYVQDPSTLLAPALLAVRPGEAVADLCAAPGGKALLLAEALAGAGTLFCGDRSPERLRRVAENLREWGNVTIAAADATRPPLPLPPGSRDAVLLDAPCSNTGVIRRRPDVRWRFSRAGLAELVALQRAILEGAAPLIRAGGRLVWSTCSIEPEENGLQVRRFLAEHPEFTLESECQLLPAALHDGAYAARLRRV